MGAIHYNPCEGCSYSHDCLACGHLAEIATEYKSELTYLDHIEARAGGKDHGIVHLADDRPVDEILEELERRDRG